MGYLINATGIEATVDGYILDMGPHRWIFAVECTGVSAIIVFVSFVLAYRSSPGAKIAGIGIGVPFLVTANILRLLAQAWIVRLFPQYATSIHDYVWQILFVILIALMCLIWTEKITPPSNESKTTISC